MSTLFTQFGILKRTSDQNSEGIGLGLLICRNLVRECGGTIQVFSEGQDCGSVFTFTMHMQEPPKVDLATAHDYYGNAGDRSN